MHLEFRTPHKHGRPSLRTQNAITMALLQVQDAGHIIIVAVVGNSNRISDTSGMKTRTFILIILLSLVVEVAIQKLISLSLLVVIAVQHVRSRVSGTSNSHFALLGP